MCTEPLRVCEHILLADVPHSDEYLKVVSGNFSQFVPKNLGLPHNAPDRVKAFYLGDRPVSWDTIDSYIDVSPVNDTTVVRFICVLFF